MVSGSKAVNVRMQLGLECPSKANMHVVIVLSDYSYP